MALDCLSEGPTSTTTAAKSSSDTTFKHHNKFYCWALSTLFVSIYVWMYDCWKIWNVLDYNQCRLSILLNYICTLSIYSSAHKQLRRHLPNPFREFSCTCSHCSINNLYIYLTWSSGRGSLKPAFFKPAIIHTINTKRNIFKYKSIVINTYCLRIIWKKSKFVWFLCLFTTYPFKTDKQLILRRKEWKYYLKNKA